MHRKGSLNIVADALLRTVAEVSVLDIAEFKPDKWYTSMIKKAQDDPDSYPSFAVANGLLYKQMFPHLEIVSDLTNWKTSLPQIVLIFLKCILIISADVLSTYLRSKNGNQYLLVSAHWFSKFVIVHPI